MCYFPSSGKDHTRAGDPVRPTNIELRPMECSRASSARAPRHCGAGAGSSSQRGVSQRDARTTAISLNRTQGGADLTLVKYEGAAWLEYLFCNVACLTD